MSSWRWLPAAISQAVPLMGRSSLSGFHQQAKHSCANTAHHQHYRHLMSRMDQLLIQQVWALDPRMDQWTRTHTLHSEGMNGRSSTPTTRHGKGMGPMNEPKEIPPQVVVPLRQGKRGRGDPLLRLDTICTVRHQR